MVQNMFTESWKYGDYEFNKYIYFFYNPLYGTKKKSGGGDPYIKKCTKTLIKFEKQFKNVLKPW